MAGKEWGNKTTKKRTTTGASGFLRIDLAEFVMRPDGSVPGPRAEGALKFGEFLL